MSTSVTVRERAASLRSFLHAPAVVAQIGAALPKHLTADRVLRQAMTLAQQNPKLLGCTQPSILAGIIQASELGLELSGPLGQAYLVPRYNKNVGGDEATFQIGYRGLIDLAYRSGKVKSISLRVVYAADEFRLFYGSMARIEHAPATEGDPGPAVGYYAICQMSNGGEDFEFMNAAQMAKFATRHAPDRFSPWKTEYDAMAMKTVARRLAKRLPLSVEFQTAAVIDEYGEAGFLGAGPQPSPGGRTDALAARLLGSPQGADAACDPDETDPGEGDGDGEAASS